VSAGGGRAPRSHFAALLQEHFGVSPASLPVVAEQLDPNHHADLQVALDALLARGGRTHELHGVTFDRYSGSTLSLAALVSQPWFVAGPVEYKNVATGTDAMPCVERGLYCVKAGGERFVLLVNTRNDFMRELLRRAALIASDEGSDIRVTQRHVDDALRELVIDGAAHAQLAGRGKARRRSIDHTGMMGTDASSDRTPFASEVKIRCPRRALRARSSGAASRRDSRACRRPVTEARA
jgi:hypothetical protein